MCFQTVAPSQLGSEKTSITSEFATLPLGAANEAGLNSRSRLKLKLHGTISTPSLRRGLLFAWSWHPWLSSKALMAGIGNKKAFTVHLSDEMAAMIDLKRKEWGLRSRGEVIERLLGWMVEPT